MAFDPEEFDMLLNEYGVVMSERTRRLIHRNNMKKKEPDVESETEEEEIFNTVCYVLNLVGRFIRFVFGLLFALIGYTLWIAAMMIWMAMVVLARLLEVIAIGLIFYLVSEYMTQNGKLQFLVH